MGKLYSYYKNDYIMRDSYSRKYDEFSNNSEYEILESLHTKNMLLSMSDTHKSNNLSSICYAILEELSKNFETWKKQAKEKINDMKKGKLTENEVYEWILKNK